MSKRGDNITLGIVWGIGAAFIATVIYHRKKFKPLKVDVGHPMDKTDFSGMLPVGRGQRTPTKRSSWNT